MTFSDCFHSHSTAIFSERVVETDPGHRFYGASASVSLFRGVQARLEQWLEGASKDQRLTDNAHTQLLFANQICLSVFDNTNSDLDMSHDGTPFRRPPKSLIDSAVETFFQTHNAVYPILSHSRFTKDLEAAYSTSGLCYEARLLSFNSIIILNLSRTTGTLDGQSQLAMETELLKPFLENSRRGFRRIKTLLTPTINRVQVLALLVCPLMQTASYALP